jgi:hypothetical protein
MGSLWIRKTRKPWTDRAGCAEPANATNAQGPDGSERTPIVETRAGFVRDFGQCGRSPASGYRSKTNFVSVGLRRSKNSARTPRCEMPRKPSLCVRMRSQRSFAMALRAWRTLSLPARPADRASSRASVARTHAPSPCGLGRCASAAHARWPSARLVADGTVGEGDRKFVAVVLGSAHRHGDGFFGRTWAGLLSGRTAVERDPAQSPDEGAAATINPCIAAHTAT